MSIDKASFMAGYLAGVKLRQYRATPTEPVIDGYLSFRSFNPFTISKRNSQKSWDGIIETSVDTESWSVWAGENVLNSAVHNEMYCLYLRGTGNTRIEEIGPQLLSSRGLSLTGTNIECRGNIETLLDYHTVLKNQHPPMASQCFIGLFWDNLALISAPQLPAITLSEECYKTMFGRTGIETAPDLPASVLSKRCYYEMFYGCPNLLRAGSISATSLSNECCQYMFSDCVSLSVIPKLNALVLPSGCYLGMFKNCSNIRISASRNQQYSLPYRIPTTGNGVQQSEYDAALLDMFVGTGGSFTSTPTINTTYYTANEVV